MPGPVSDSFDPEFGTGEVAAKIESSVQHMYKRVSAILSQKQPINIRVLVDLHDKLQKPIPATLTEWEWRIIRFALERAQESI